MNGDSIYNLFMDELDGETLESEEQALRLMNVAYRNILADRIWHVLKKSSNLTARTTSLAGITDLDQVLEVRAKTGSLSTDVTPLSKARFDQRFDTTFDYWWDMAGNALQPIGDTSSYTQYPWIVDYKYRPDDLTMDTAPVFHEVGHPAIAYEMILVYKESDENSDFYREIKAKKEDSMNKLIQWNEDLETY
jgi:hypothetical protein